MQLYTPGLHPESERNLRARSLADTVSSCIGLCARDACDKLFTSRTHAFYFVLFLVTRLQEHS